MRLFEIDRAAEGRESERTSEASERANHGDFIYPVMIMIVMSPRRERAKRASLTDWGAIAGGERSEPDANERAKRVSEPPPLGRSTLNRASGASEIGNHGPFSTVLR